MRRWVAAGNSVALFTSRYAGSASEDEIDGVKIVRGGNEYTVHLAARHWYCRQRQRPDLVVDEIHGVPFCLSAYAGVPVLAWIYEVARDIWFRMYPYPVAATGWSLEAALLRWYVRGHLTFLTDSRSTAADLVGLGLPEEKITTIEPGITCIPVAQLPEKEGEPTIIFVGRLVRMKGIEDAIVALAMVRRRLGRGQLWVVGTGQNGYSAELRHHAVHNGVAAAVHFLGRLDEGDKFERLRRAHILVHPSQREGWGINVIEANAMGTPAVGYNVPGLRDSILHERTGVLCPPRQPAALSDAICSLLGAPQRYRAMQDSGLRWSSRFTWDSSARKSLALMQGLAGSL